MDTSNELLFLILVYRERKPVMILLVCYGQHAILFLVSTFNNNRTPIEARRVPRKPHDCVLVGLITTPFPV